MDTAKFREAEKPQRTMWMLSYARKGKNWVLRGVYPAPIELDRPCHPAASWGKIQSVAHFKGDLFLLLANSDLGALARGLFSRAMGAALRSETSPRAA